METQKNLHAAIPPALLNQAHEEAQAQRISIDEVMRQAVERYLEEKRGKKAGSSEARPADRNAAYADSIRQLASFGKRHELSLGGMSVAELLRESRP